MGEIKSVKVDNWGVFFLQKLQNFFNKTDYCDLTLQFRDNSQLKVHRLVLSACTDYFNVLEQTCEVVDDAIIMPNGLQADVVVPIVNFMYTGTLEFELKMYNRLLRTAKDMNMTVLLKLLEAHRRTMEMHPQKAPRPASPKSRRRTAGVGANANLATNASGGRSLIQTNQGKRLVMSSTAPQNRIVASSNTLARLPSAGPMPVRQIGSTTFTRIKVENEQQETNTSSASGGGYSLIKHSPQQQPQQTTSPFEQLRKGYNSNKRPAVTTFVSPPAKKPNLEDVKEFAEQQRMRKQIAAEYGDDDYDASNIMDDDTIHNDDDDDEMMTSSGQTQTAQTTSTSSSAGVQTVASSSSQHQQQSEDPPGTTTIIVKHEGPDKPPTIVVKDNSNSKMNHAKIISEVLRQYPHLVRSNKNIKLKIMPNAGGQAQKIIVKKETLEAEKLATKPATKPATKISNTTKISNAQQQQQQHQSVKTLTSNIVANRPKTVQQQAESTPNVKTQSTAAQTTSNKETVDSTTASVATTTIGQPQKRRIDSKTMHALIALGAENTTGPWLCLRCGRNGHPISIPSYRGFRRHLINTHKETIDPALCEHCGWRSSSKRELHFHMQMEHKIKTNLYIFPECQLCLQMCIDSDGLNQHLIDSHPDENKQQCIYCNKIFPEEIQLYTHMKTFHKKHALEDGIIDYSDEEVEQEQKDEQLTKKINILSDISLPIASTLVKTESFVQHQESAPSEEYLQDQEHDQDNTETKFVAADGSEVILTAEQRKEILSQLNQEHDGGSGVVMVLNENQQQQQYTSGETQSDQGAISHDEISQATTVTNEEREVDGNEEEEEPVAEEEDQHDDNQIYNEMKSLQPNLEDDSTNHTEAATEAPNEEASLHEEEQEHEQEDLEGIVQHEERAEHLDESKESIDNLEWAENLISEHDLADEVSSQTTNENIQSNKNEDKEEETKDEDNKSQDEISKKLKELTGDWSEDDDEDMPEEVPLRVLSQLNETVKENDKLRVAAADVAMTEAQEKVTETDRLAKEQEKDMPEFEDHAELLASLQSTDKDECDKVKEIKSETTDADLEDTENIDEDDIDIALKSLHKEDLEEINEANSGKPEKEKNIVKDKEDVKKDSETINEPEPQEPAHDKLKDNHTSEEIKEDKSNVMEPVKDAVEADGEKTEEQLAKEQETIDEPEATSSTVEVDEETKKDLINSILSEQAETMEDTATETLTSTGAEATELGSLKKELEKVQGEGEAKTTGDLNTENETTVEEEFLDISPEKVKIKESLADNVETTSIAATTEPAATSEPTDIAESSSTSAKEESTISSEERVKSLISEWGDDEDEDDNDTDLTANL